MNTFHTAEWQALGRHCARPKGLPVGGVDQQFQPSSFHPFW